MHQTICLFCCERTHRHTLCVRDTMLPHHTKCRGKMPFPTLTRSQSHPDFTLGISYHSADFRILACTSDHNCWSSAGNRVKITLLQPKHIKDKKSRISFYIRREHHFPFFWALESHALCFLSLFSQSNRNYCLSVKKTMVSCNWVYKDQSPRENGEEILPNEPLKNTQTLEVFP